VSAFARLFQGLELRTAVMMGLIVTYLWRFQDLAEVLAPLRPAMLLSLVAVGILLFHMQGHVLGKALRRPFVVVFVIWTAWLGLSVVFALDVDRAWVFWSDYHLKNALMFIFVMSTLTSLSSIRLAVAAHLIGVFVIDFYYIKQGMPSEWTPLAGVDRNDLALMFNLATPLCIFYALTEKQRWARWGAWALAVTVATSTIMTQSRGGFLTVAVVVLFLSFRIRGVKFYKRFLPLAFFAVGVVFLPQNVKDRLETILETEEDYNRTENTGRVQIWQRGIGYMLSRPVTGVGMENFSVAELDLALEARTERYWRGHAAHNIYVQVGAESGVVGLLLFVTMIIFSIVSLNRSRARMVRHKVPDAWVLLADLLTASFLAYCVGGFFLSWGYSPFLFFLMALVAGYQRCEPQMIALGRGGARPSSRRPRRPTRRAASVEGRTRVILGAGH
jgi:probable O-glycosylation ligase (exosortase A-associated)